jgi:serine/threonine-protein kinase NIM1
MSSAKTIIPINNQLSTFKRNNSLINSSRIVNKNIRNELIQIVQSNDIIQVRSYSNDQLEESSIESDKDFERYIMIPTRTNGDHDLLNALNPLEMEVRKLIHMLGISNELLEKHIDHGPRSEIIGIYRILLMRLKTQKEQASITNNSSSHTLDKNSRSCSRISNGQHQSQRKKRNTFCAIL